MGADGLTADELKARLRRMYLAIRAGVDAYERRSNAIAEALFGTAEWAEAEVVFAYASFNGEADTARIIDRAAAEGKAVCLPVVGDGGEMRFARFTSLEACELNRYGVIEPTGEAFEPTAKTLLLAPGVAFGRGGERLGYGKGYYDRYMSGRTFLAAFGLAFEAQVAERLPQGAHDRRLDRVITEAAAGLDNACNFSRDVV